MSREKANDLLDRYLYAIGQELPAEQRDDVKAELRSLLTEQLDERIAEGVPAETAATELLQSFGKPDDVAMQYGPQGRYLIGPHFYPYFLFFAKLNCYIVTGIYILAWILGFASGNTRLPEFLRADSIIGWFAELAELLAVNLAFMVAVFAILERVTKPGEAPSEKKKEWNPAELEAVPAKNDPDRISEPGLIGKIYVIVALAVLLNFFPAWFGIFIGSGKSLMVVPYYALGVYLPVQLLNVWWAGALALNVWLLNLRRWTREARWIELALNAIGAGILFVVIRASTFALDVDWLARHEATSPPRLLNMIERLAPMGGAVLKFALSGILIATVVEGLVRLARVLRRYPLSGSVNTSY